MRGFSFFAFAASVVVIASVVVQANNIVEYDSCTDKALCQAASCKHESLPDQLCFSSGNKTYQQSTMLACNPVLQTVGVLFVYSDPVCTSLIGTEAFECGTCDPHKMNSVRCIKKNGAESIEVDSCFDSGCSMCKKKYNVPIDTCVPTQNEQGKITAYLKYEGVRVENSVYVANFASADCSGQPFKVDQLPSDSCIAGTKVSCQYGRTNATLPKWLRRK